MLKPYIKCNQQKRIEAKKNDHKDGRAFYKLTKSAVSGKTKKNLRNRVDVTTGKQQKRLLEMDINNKLCSTKNIWQKFGGVS